MRFRAGLPCHGFLVDTALDIPDPVPDPVTITTTSALPIGTMVLAGDALAHVVFSDTAGMTLEVVPNSRDEFVAGADIMQIVIPGDLTEAAVTLAKRFAVTGNQPGAGSIGSALQPQPQAHGLALQPEWDIRCTRTSGRRCCEHPSSLRV